MKALVLPLAIMAMGMGCGKSDNTEWEAINKEVRELRNSGDYDRAILAAQRSVSVAEKNHGSDHRDVAASLNNLAELYRDQGKYAEAEPLYKRSLAIWEEALGPEHPNIANSLENHARLLRATGRDGEADRMEVRAKAMRAKHPEWDAQRQ